MYNVNLVGYYLFSFLILTNLCKLIFSVPTVRGLKHLPSGVINKKSCKSKRVRTIFTPEQLERLEAEFERQQYMVGPERLYLAHTLQLTEAQVNITYLFIVYKLSFTTLFLKMGFAQLIAFIIIKNCFQQKNNLFVVICHSPQV